MANERREHFNLVNGTLTTTITSAATTFTSTGLSSLGVIDTTNYCAIVMESEIMWVTAHTAAATTATVLRGQEGTTAAAHNSPVAWVHGPTAWDFIVPQCRAYNNANISHATSGAWQTCTLNTERYQVDPTALGIHSTSTNTSRMTCRQAGKYLLTGHLLYAFNATGARGINFNLNGSGVFLATQINPAVTTGSAGTYLSLATVWNFVVGDYVEMQGFQDSGGALNILSTGDISPELTFTRIGD